MNNKVQVRFTKFQNVDSNGTPTGKPTFGYRLYDEYEQTYDNSFQSIEDMKNAGLNPENVCEYICNHHDNFDEQITNYGLYLNGQYCQYNKDN